MYRVITSCGFSFDCVEKDDVIVLADELQSDSDQNVVVVDLDKREVVYKTGKLNRTGPLRGSVGQSYYTSFSRKAQQERLQRQLEPKERSCHNETSR